MSHLLALTFGLAVGAVVERWRWLRSACARDWMRRTGEKGRLL